MAIIHKNAHAVQLRTMRDAIKAKKLFDTVDDIQKTEDGFEIKMRWNWRYWVHKGHWVVTDFSQHGRLNIYSPVAFEKTFQTVEKKRSAKA